MRFPSFGLESLCQPALIAFVTGREPMSVSDELRSTSMTFVPALAVTFILSVVAAPAIAQTAEGPAVDAPAAPSEPALCTDRPTKSNAVCTVPQGKLQIETDLPNWTRNDDAGTRMDVILYANPYVKYGLGPNTDVEVNWAPYETVRVRGGGVVDRLSGVGDVYVRLKQRLTDPSAKLQVGVIPFFKAPTARRGIGNREWEGGVALPVQYTLPHGFTLTTSPEVDLLADSTNSNSRHAQLIGTANVGKALSSTVTAYAEFWAAQNFDPAGTIHQYSADFALAWLVHPKLQIDLGGNFGLNRQTPDAQVYLGLSTRF
jgi:hypothetical protein